MLYKFTPIILLIISNIFMTFAWYGHLKYGNKPLIIVILLSWLIAFVEYCFAVPANRIGHNYYSAAGLKTFQRFFKLTIFSFFSVPFFVASFPLSHFFGFFLFCSGAFFFFLLPFLQIKNSY
ncbi:DMT family protein [Proteus mirabilis]